MHFFEWKILCVVFFFYDKTFVGVIWISSIEYITPRFV